MLTANLIKRTIPRLQLQDSIGKALQHIHDYRVTHLPVVSDEILLGIISEEDLLDAEDKNISIQTLQKNFIRAAVKDNVHFLSAVNNIIKFETNVVPVVKGNNEYVGMISTRDLLKTLGNFAGADEIGGIIVLEMERLQFAISEISRIVESNDSHILHLNTTTDSNTGILTVTLHINKREISAIVDSFERHDYTVAYYFGTERFANEVSTNYKNLMNYLDI